MIAVTVTFRKFNNNSLGRRTGDYRSNMGKRTSYIHICIGRSTTDGSTVEKNVIKMASGENVTKRSVHNENLVPIGSR
jgi:hypothetical protein